MLLYIFFIYIRCYELSSLLTKSTKSLQKVFPTESRIFPDKDIYLYIDYWDEITENIDISSLLYGATNFQEYVKTYYEIVIENMYWTVDIDLDSLKKSMSYLYQCKEIINEVNDYESLSYYFNSLNIYDEKIQTKSFTNEPTDYRLDINIYEDINIYSNLDTINNTLSLFKRDFDLVNDLYYNIRDTYVYDPILSTIFNKVFKANDIKRLGQLNAMINNLNKYTERPSSSTIISIKKEFLDKIRDFQTTDAKNKFGDNIIAAVDDIFLNLPDTGNYQQDDLKDEVFAKKLLGMFNKKVNVLTEKSLNILRSIGPLKPILDVCSTLSEFNQYVGKHDGDLTRALLDSALTHFGQLPSMDSDYAEFEYKSDILRRLQKYIRPGDKDNNSIDVDTLDDFISTLDPDQKFFGVVRTLSTTEQIDDEVNNIVSILKDTTNIDFSDADSNLNFLEKNKKIIAKKIQDLPEQQSSELKKSIVKIRTALTKQITNNQVSEHVDKFLQVTEFLSPPSETELLKKGLRKLKLARKNIRKANRKNLTRRVSIRKTP